MRRFLDRNGAKDAVRDIHQVEAGECKIERVKKKQLMRKSSSYLKEFTDSTSLHGLKYIGQDRSKTERIWWCIMIISSVGMCSYLIYRTWIKWDRSPVIVSFDDKPTSTWQIPYPAVTVCTGIKIKQSVYNVTEKIHLADTNLTKEEINEFYRLGMVCDEMMRIMGRGENFTDKPMTEIIANVTPSMREVMMVCNYGNYFRCTKLFTPILTEEGLCFTFNMLNVRQLLKENELFSEYDNKTRWHSSDWNPEDGYPEDLPSDTYPYRGFKSTPSDSLKLYLIAKNEDIDFVCRRDAQSFKLILHSPLEFPDVTQNFLKIAFNQSAVISVEPSMVKTSSGLKDYNPKRRQCYFTKERYLKYYNYYTQHNCETECLVNYTAHYCGCVPFHLPRNISTPMCSFGKMQCVSTAQEEFYMLQISENIKNFNLTRRQRRYWKESVEIVKQCDCMPSCTHIAYEADVTQFHIDWDQVMKAYMEGDFMAGKSISEITITLKAAQFIAQRRSELYGHTDFLANCGGLLGLFLGFSLLSMIEIIYFFTLRLFCNIKSRISKKLHN